MKWGITATVASSAVPLSSFTMHRLMVANVYPSRWDVPFC